MHGEKPVCRKSRDSVYGAWSLHTWQQAVGYFLSSGPVGSNTLKSLLHMCLDSLMQIGLDIKVVTKGNKTEEPLRDFWKPV